MRLLPLSVSLCLLITNSLALRAATSSAPAATPAKPSASSAASATSPAFPSVQQIALASSANVPAPTLDKAKHDAFVDLAKKGNIDVLFLGDSITDWWREADAKTNHNGKDVFDKYFGNLKVANFGIAGEGTQHVLWRLQNGEGTGFSPKVIMLMIGTNNLGRNSDDQIVIGIATVVAELRKDFPAAKILLLGIFPRNPPTDSVRGRISRINQMISGVSDLNRIFYLDIGSRFLAKDGSIPADVMADQLHPTAKGYQIWADAIKEPLANLLKLSTATPVK